MIVMWLATRFGISKILVEVILSVVAIGAILSVGNYVINKIVDKQVAKAREEMAGEIDAIKKKEWALKDEQNKKMLEKIEAARKEAEAEITALTYARQMTRAELAKSLAESAKGREVSDANIRSIPSDKLVVSVRSYITEYIKSHPDFVPVVPYPRQPK
jgi:polyribonucleotide nucleotidyltransferase